MDQDEFNGRRVLVVEDEPGIAAVCMRTLNREGFQVDVAVDGKIALEMWAKKIYGLCISDIRTPRMDGIELYRQLEIKCPEVAKRFIFTTGDMLSGRVKTFLESTGRPFLTKPFTPEDLRAIVSTFFVAI